MNIIIPIKRLVWQIFGFDYDRYTCINCLENNCKKLKSPLIQCPKRKDPIICAWEIITKHTKTWNDLRYLFEKCDHYKILNKNSSRANNEPYLINLRLANKSKIIKSEETILKLDLSYCDFEENVFEGLTFKDCKFFHSNFANVTFIDCTFVDCDFSGASFNRTTFIKSSKPRKIDFHNVDFHNVDFHNVDWTNSRIKKANINPDDTISSLTSGEINFTKVYNINNTFKHSNNVKFCKDDNNIPEEFYKAVAYKSKYLKIIYKNSSEWNKLRKLFPEWKPDLENEIFYNHNEKLSLCKFNFQNCRFYGAKFDENSKLESADVGGADFTNAELPKKYFEKEKVLIDKIKVSTASLSVAFVTMVIIAFFICLKTLTTNDILFLTNATNFIIPVLNTDVEVKYFFLFAPLLLVAIYAFWLSRLRKFWIMAGDMPAYNNRGERLSKTLYPWFFDNHANDYLELKVKKYDPVLIIQNLMLYLFTWGFIPTILILIWLKYLINHRSIISLVHIGVISFVVFLSCFYNQCLKRNIRHNKIIKGKKSQIFDFTFSVTWILFLVSFLFINYKICVEDYFDKILAVIQYILQYLFGIKNYNNNENIINDIIKLLITIEVLSLLLPITIFIKSEFFEKHKFIENLKIKIIKVLRKKSTVFLSIMGIVLLFMLFIYTVLKSYNIEFALYFDFDKDIFVFTFFAFILSFYSFVYRFFSSKFKSIADNNKKCIKLLKIIIKKIRINYIINVILGIFILLSVPKISQFDNSIIQFIILITILITNFHIFLRAKKITEKESSRIYLLIILLFILCGYLLIFRTNLVKIKSFYNLNNYPVYLGTYASTKIFNSNLLKDDNKIDFEKLKKDINKECINKEYHYINVCSNKILEKHFLDRGISLVELKEMNLQFMEAKNAYLPKTDLSFTNLRSAAFEEAFLAGSLFNEAYILNTNFFKSNLIGTNFTKAQINKSDFKGADLKYSKLIKAQINKTQMHSCNLRGSDFANAEFKDSSLSGSNLEYSVGFYTKFINTNLGFVNLSYSDLRKAEFKNLNIENAILDKTILKDATFENVTFKDVHFQNVDLKNVTLKNTLFWNCTFNGTSIKNIFFNSYISDNEQGLNFDKLNVDNSNLIYLTFDFKKYCYCSDVNSKPALYKYCCSSLRKNLNKIKVDIKLDRAGDDYRNFEIASWLLNQKNFNIHKDSKLHKDIAKICADACYKEKSCKAFSYVKPNGQSDKPICWLKDGIPKKTQNEINISGCKDIYPECNL